MCVIERDTRNTRSYGATKHGLYNNYITVKMVIWHKNKNVVHTTRLGPCLA